MYFLCDVFQYTCIPNIILSHEITRNKLHVINHDNSDSIIVFITTMNVNTPMLYCDYIILTRSDHLAWDADIHLKITL